MSGLPRILGVAGGGLTNATWAKNEAVAKIGKAGEVKTATLLNGYATPENGVTVMHDLAIPIPGFTANVDHVVVSGRTVHIIDAKVWRPAFYWTVGGATRRGFERFEAADKQTMVMATEALTGYLAKRSIAADFVTPVLAIWPSSTTKNLSVRFLRVPGARSMTGEQFTRHAEKAFSPSTLFGLGGGGGKPADPAIVEALSGLLTSYRRR